MDLIADALVRSAELMLRSVPVMVIGVFLAELLIALRISDRIARLARPVTAFSHLSDTCGTSFMMAFISTSAANAMLANYHHHGLIGRKELVIASLMNSFPAVVMHWRILLPVYIPLLGIAGGIYFLILTLVGFIKTGCVMIAGRFLLPGRDQGDCEDERVLERKAGDSVSLLRQVWQSSRKPLTRILLITIPTIILVALLMELGVFDMLGSAISGISGVFPIPVEGVPIIAAQFASYIAAAGVASPLYFGGQISTRDLVVTLLVGNVLSSVTRTLRWFGPVYVGIFGPRIGTEIMLISTLLRNGIMLVVILLITVFW